MNQTIEILKKVGAIIENDHFVGASGLHFDTYVNKDALFLHPEFSSEVGKLFAEKYKDDGIEVVDAPALGGIILSQWTAYHLSKLTGRDVLAVFSEKTIDDKQILKRGYNDAVKGKKVLVVEDIVTTGGSMLKTVEAVKNAGGNIFAVCALVNKNPTKVNAENLGIPFDSLSEFEIKTYDEADCPFCKSGMPVNINIGHGRQFMENKNK